MTKRPEHNSAIVPSAQQVEETASETAIRKRWLWVEPSVWTVRMLTTLENPGEKGAKWFRLIDKVFAERNLLAAWQQVARNDGAPGVDHIAVKDFSRRLPEEIRTLSDALHQKTFRPQAIRRVHIPKPGTQETRPLGIPTVRDRVVQAAIVNVIEPIFEREFAEHSYGFRPGRGCKDALRRVTELLQRGYVHVVDADLKGYFDSIPHDRLMDRVEDKVTDGSLLALIKNFVQADILDGASQWTPETGAPQGAVLSPLLSNIYLNPLDHLMIEQGFEMVRYADDFVILCRTAEAAERALNLVQQWTSDQGLTLHPTKTRIVDTREASFDFLGYTFKGQKHWPRKKSLAKLRETIRTKTSRTAGRSLHHIIADVNRSLQGWFEYFQHSSYRNVFTDIDGWVRMRLRSILRKRQGGRGRGSGHSHVEWPNRFFTDHGLFSLKAAREAVRQSSLR